MSDDLISRKIVMDYLREQQATVIIEKNKNNSVSNYYIPGIQESIQTFMNFIVQAPTTYDVDKVIQNIEERKQALARNIRLNTQEYDIEREVENAMIPYDSCIDIVEEGGV